MKLDVNVKSLVVARPGHYFLDMDWSQVEYRIIAGFSQDPGLLDAFENSIDLHVKTASVMWGIPIEAVTKDQRGDGKTMNYAVSFGAQADNIARQIGCSKEEAQDKLNRWNQGYIHVTAWKASIEEFAKKNRYVETYFGRKRWLNFGGQGVSEKAARAAYFAALREAVNMPVQGTAADLLKMTILKLYPWLRAYFPEVHPVLSTHDSLTFEVPESYDPHYLVGALRPVCEYPKNFLPGFPAITSEFEFGTEWGALTKVTEAAGALSPTPLMAAEAGAPTAESMIPPAAIRQTEAEDLLLVLHDPPSRHAVEAFRHLLTTMPGPNRLWVSLMGEPPTSVIEGVGLGPNDGHLLAHLFDRFELRRKDEGLALLGRIA